MIRRLSASEVHPDGDTVDTGDIVDTRRHRGHQADRDRQIARIFEVDPLRCRRCGGSIQLIAFITGRSVIVRILEHIGEPSGAPRMATIRGPPSVDAMQQRDDLWTRRSLNPDPRVDVMPDCENQSQDLLW